MHGVAKVLCLAAVFATPNDKQVSNTTKETTSRNRTVQHHSFYLLVPPSILTLLPVRVELPRDILVDLDANGDRTLLGLHHNQVMVVGNILDGSFEQASARDDAQSNECSHDVDFAVCKAMIDVLSVWVNLDEATSEECFLLFTNARTTTLAKCEEGLLQLVVRQAINKPSFRDELIRVREELGVPVVDHRSHADRSASRDEVLSLAVFALVDQVLFAGDSC